MKIITFLFKLIPSRILSLQARKPSGIIGSIIMTKILNSGNAELNSFAKELLNLKRNDRVLEIGFGTGKLINEIAKITTDGIVEGMDFSKVMYKEATKNNKKFISQGKVIMHHAECNSLPFEAEIFDKLCLINTIYFLKNPKKHFGEMFRVIKYGGNIVIGFRDVEQMNRMKIKEDIFKTYSKNDVVNLLSEIGFTEIQIMEKNAKPFVSYCAVAKKN